MRESYVNLSSNTEDKLQVLSLIKHELQPNVQIYRDNFERAYIEATEAFYRVQAPDHLKENGVQASQS